MAGVLTGGGTETHWVATEAEVGATRVRAEGCGSHSHGGGEGRGGGTCCLGPQGLRLQFQTAWRGGGWACLCFRTPFSNPPWRPRTRCVTPLGQVCT